MSKARTLADFISDGSEFADGTISVAEVSGAAPLASPTFTGTASGTFSGPLTGNVTGNLTGNVTGAVTGDVTAPEIDLSAISATISDTAVDIFVYDTRKDSDGGAWRKRTQHTSWYNETLNTATRGSRKEFPAVAVIVTTTDTATIYDGDDPDLPMWMVFNTSSSAPADYAIVRSGGVGADVSSASALNGIIALPVSYNGLFYQNFVTDDCYRVNTASTIQGGNIAARNGGMSFSNTVGSYGIAHATVNDVAMTVLPNAPIDAATGLPVPTIAVATDGGVSVIKDDGTVVSGHTGVAAEHIMLHESGALVYGVTGAGNDNFSLHLDLGNTTRDTFYDARTNEGVYDTYLNEGSGECLFEGNEFDLALAQSKGLLRVAEQPDFSTGLHNRTTSDYNTGWMNGDIKLATLSDTDATNVTGSELVTNGTFDSGVSGWNTSFGSTITWNSGSQTATVTSNGSNSWNGATQNITGLTVGKTYVLTADIITSNNWGSVNFAAGANSGVKYGSYSSWNGGSTFPLQARAQFTATATSVTVSIDSLNTTSATVTEIDNISVRLAEEDRSVNNNGLQVFGTVTKSAVSSGADLVAYSGFNGSNWLKLPYQSWMDIGTGDICFMGWIKHSQTDATRVFLSVGNETVNDNRMAMYTLSDGTVRFILRQNSGEEIIASSSGAIADGVWHHVIGLRSNGIGQIYVDGKASGSSVSSTKSIVQTGTSLKIGVDYNYSGGSANAIYASMALWRASTTAPSPEQIKKIYEDEKVLFQEGAQATLYGSSDAVTALAYDDSNGILSVGTSAGRSDFQGLRRVNNTTNAVGAAISASNGLIVEE